MRKFKLMLLAALTSVQAWAIPAAPGARPVTQPDGSEISIEIHGDEFYHYYTTADGYSVVMNDAGYYTYAQRNADGRVVASSTIAHDADKRSAAELELLSTMERHTIDAQSTTAAKVRKAERNDVLRRARYDYTNFRGLVILVNYNDASFLRTDANDFYNRFINEEDYNGYDDLPGQSTRNRVFTGSVRDYFSDNSGGLFKPTFDVVGPIDVDRSINYPQGTESERLITLWSEVLQAADSLVNFKDYDRDNDGVVDMLYFIVPGSGSNSDSANPNHLWPHAWNLAYSGLRLDGVTFGRYACSTEYLYSTSYRLLDGIGTICHEFSHVLGLPDLYDTDYSTNGQSNVPAQWEVMSSGSYNNNSRTPAGYSLYDRYASGFIVPEVISDAGSYTMQPLGTSLNGYRINSPVENEFFLLENRQATKWDAYVPGHGLIIARVDSTDASPWTRNAVNANASRNYYELVRAGGSGTSGSTDPFPGDNNVTAITNATNPNLKPYSQVPNTLALNNITETDNVISFNVTKEDDLTSVIEDFENMTTETRNDSNVVGTYARWNFVNAAVETPSDSTLVNGSKGASMRSPSSITMAHNINFAAYQISVVVNNPTLVAAKVTVSYMLKDDSTWTALANSDGATTTTIAASSKTTITFNCNITENVRFRISQSAGSKTNKIWVDDFTIAYSGTTAVNSILADGTVAAGKLQAVASGSSIAVTNASQGTAALYTISGKLVKTAQVVDGKAEFTGVDHGFYIVSQNGKSVKVVL